MTGELMADTALQGLWHLSDVNDASGNGYNLTNNNVVTFPAGRFGKAGNFVAASIQSLSIADASCANLEISGSQTWMCWAKFTTVTGLLGLVCKSNSKRLWTNNTVLTFDMPGLTTNATVTSSVTPVVDRWYFIVGRYDGAKLSIFVNGTKTEVTATGSATDTNGVFLIGNQEAANIPHNGQIDEVAIFNRALTDKEISNYYSWSSGLFTKIL